MPSVTGSVLFDRDRNLNPLGDVSGLANIPVALQNLATGNYLAVNTDANGVFQFLNVPAGSYRLVEIYGLGGGVPSPGDFALAVPGTLPPAQVPPISAAVNPPPGATNLDCLTPNTLLLTVAADDLSEQNFWNGPVRYTPLQLELDPCAVVYPENLVTAADGGTFGSFPPGTPANTGPATNPYPLNTFISPDFTYVVPDPTDYTPLDGEFTIQNIMNNAMSNVIGAWWRVADHTTGNETGRMMVVNGYNGSLGAVIFRVQIPVQPNSTYLFSAWILNLFRVTGYEPPRFAIRILGQGGNILYNSSLGFEIPESTQVPEWKEIGTVVNSYDNETLLAEFVSEGEAAIGNDFALDDISFRPVLLPAFVPQKSANRDSLSLGETVTFTVTLTNGCQNPLMDLFFQDPLPAGLSFQPGSVVVDDTPYPDVNPAQGFYVPYLDGGQTRTIRFDAVATSIPPCGQAVNQAVMSFYYTPIDGGIADRYAYPSNPVSVSIFAPPPEAADLSLYKGVNRPSAAPGERVTYTLTIRNQGPAQAEAVVVTDPLPSQLLGGEFSLDGGATWSAWPGAYSAGSLPAGSTLILLLRGTVAPQACGSFSNIASVAGATLDPNPCNNRSCACVQVRPICPPCPPCPCPNCGASVCSAPCQSGYLPSLPINLPDPCAPRPCGTYTVVGGPCCQ